MTRSSLLRRFAPSVALLAAGVLLGAMLVRPAQAHIGTTLQHLESHLDGRYVRKATTLTRVASCNGFGFMPLASASGYTSNATRRTVGASPDIHTCAMSLPQAARITAVRFSIYDEAPAGHVGCAFRRNHLSPPDLGAETLAGVPATTEPGTPGAVVKTDTTIDTPVVNNRKFSYWAECAMNNPGVGVIGVSVSYSISAANG